MGEMIAEKAKSYVGILEGSPRHHDIIDNYNSIRPLPRGYRMPYTGAWCAVFVSEVMRSCGVKGYPFECGVWEMENALQDLHCQDSVPHTGDVVIFAYSHCGIVVDVTPSGGIVTVEGNASDSVMQRQYDNIYGMRFYNPLDIE